MQTLKQGKKLLMIMLSALLVLSSVFTAIGPVKMASAEESAKHLVISQVYGGGGNGGAVYSHDFIELYNPTSSPITLDGLELRYLSASPSQATLTAALEATRNIFELKGTIEPYSYFLTQQAVGGNATLPKLPTPDMEGSLAMGGSSGIVVLVDPAKLDAPVDLVGYGASTKFNEKNPTGATGNALAAIRKSDDKLPANNRGLDTDDNAADFTVTTPDPRNSKYGEDGETTDPTPEEPEELKVTSIKEVRSYPADKLALIEGVITHIDGQNIYIQDETAAIVLYNYANLTVEVGNKIRISGKMVIFRNLQELSPYDGYEFKLLEESAEVPAVKVVSADQLSVAKGEEVEAQIVRINNVKIGALSGTVYKAESEGFTFNVYSPLVAPNDEFEYIIGVVHQYNEEYQLIPLSPASLVKDELGVIATPGSGKVIIGNAVTLASALQGDIYYTVDGTEPTTASAKYTAPIVITENTTIKAFFTNGERTGKVYVFEYEATEKPRIRDVQGKGHKSPLLDSQVEDIEGIVTQITYNVSGNTAYKGFFIQDPQPDNDDHTSEGIFVYSTNVSLQPKVGDLVQVSGKVEEFNEGQNTNLTSTQIRLSTIKTISSGNALPEPVVLGKNGRIIPSEVIDNDQFTEFDPEEDAIDFFESLEGMLVKLEDATITSPYWTSGNGNNQYYNIATRVENDGTELVSPLGGIVLKEDNNLNPQRVLIAYSNPGVEVNTGDKFESDVVGVIGYNNGNFKLLPAKDALPKIVPANHEQEVTTIQFEEDKLNIAAYNIENYYPGVGAEKTNKLAESFAHNLNSPDIIAVVEMQDANGPTNDGTVDADPSALIAAIKEKGGVEYSYVEVAPENNKDGGQGGANIRVGFLYNAKRVQLADSENGKGTPQVAVQYDAEKQQLSHNPGLIDPKNEALNSSRKPVAAEFVFNGEKVIVIGAHFNSKSGDLTPFGATQPAVRSSEVQRQKIGTLVNSFVKDVLAKNEDANVVVLGDLNDFQFSPAVTALKGEELDNLVDQLPANDRYTYTYDGNSQVLDHILVSKNLSANAVVDAVRLNADFSPSAGRVSDHDPILAQLDFSEVFNLSVIHTNDTHANLEGTTNHIARRVQTILDAKASAKNPLLVDAGDVFSGSVYFNKYNGLADLAFMNLVGYDAMTFGNHEFDKNAEVLAAFVKEAQFPFVSSNIDFSGETVLGELVQTTTNEEAASGKIYPVMIKMIAGEKVGIIGLTTEDTANIASPGNVKFNDAIESAKQAVATLQDMGVNKVIALSHLGYEGDLVLAEEVAGLDIIVGGHSHTLLQEPVVITDEETNEPKLIVQAGEKGQYVGQLDVVFDEAGILKEWNGKVISVDAKDSNGKFVVKENEEALKMLQEDYKPGIEALMAEVIGKTEILLDGERGNVRTKETNLGNLIADGMLHAAKQADPNTVIALQNGGGIRASIKAGNISLGDALTVLPFNNDLVTIKVTGKELLAALENGVSKVEVADGRFPHVAGMRFDYDSTKPAGSRIVRVQIEENGKLVPLDLEKFYTLATNAFTAKGGDFYDSFKEAYEDGRMTALYLPDFDVFQKYIQHLGTITADNAKVEGRIIDLLGKEVESTPAPTEELYAEGNAPTPFVEKIVAYMNDEIEAPKAFTDVANHWAKEPISLFAKLNIISGYDDNSFKPNNNMTRAEFVSLISRIFNLNETDTVTNFSDVPANAWYKDSLNRAVAAGVIAGTGNNKFNPSGNITREEIVAILSRVMKFEQLGTKEVEIKDLDQASNYAKEALKQAVAAGILVGNGNGYISPKANATRAEVLQIIMSGLKLDPAIKALLEEI